MDIMDFRLNSTFYLRPILHTFPWKFQVCDVKINILRDRFLFYTEEAAIFEVILSICSEFYQIGTPHFSLEGVQTLAEYKKKRPSDQRIVIKQSRL